MRASRFVCAAQFIDTSPRRLHSLDVNQGIAFARTLRALDADGFGASKLGLLLAALLLIAWIWWAVAVRVPQYETTANVRIESGHAMAYFPADAIGRILVGQPATLHLDAGTFPARVQTVGSDHAELVLAPNPQSPIPASSSASAEIETTRVSPAAIALRTLTRGNR
jgi:hypothetical protein